MKRGANNTARPATAKARRTNATAEGLMVQLLMLTQRAAAARNQREQLALYRRISDVRHQLHQLHQLARAG